MKKTTQPKLNDTPSKPLSGKPASGKLSPLKLVANLAQALRSLGIDIPILDIKLDGDDLLITLHGGRVERFPLDYDLVLKIDKLDSTDEADAPLRLALSALGRDKHSPAGWLPELKPAEVLRIEDYVLSAADILNGNWDTPKRRSKPKTP